MSRVGAYEILEQIGQGGMGIVYLGRRVDRPDALVAVKLYETENQRASPARRKRFRREAEAMAGLDHPNIVAIRDFGVEPEYDYFAMEYVDGGDLSGLLEEEQPVDEVLALMATVCEAIDYAHDRGVVHRDLKPQNILLARDGTPKVTDFGLARFLDARTRLTRTGQVLGTPFYMSPEQCRGESDNSDGRSDVFALGVLLYQLLTGELPFEGKNPVQLFNAINERDPLPPTGHRPEIPVDVEAICLCALQKDPEERYASAGEMAADLRRVLAGERPRAAAGLASGRSALIGALLLVVLAGVGLTLGWNRWEPAREESRTEAGTAPVEEPEPASLEEVAEKPFGFLKAGNGIEAEKAFTALLEEEGIAPHTRLMLHYYRGVCRYVLGRLEPAVSDLTKGIEGRESFPEARLYLARAFRRLKRWEEAEEDARALVVAQPSGPAYFLLADIRRRRGFRKQAEEAFERCWAFPPEDLEEERLKPFWEKRIEATGTNPVRRARYRIRVGEFRVAEKELLPILRRTQVATRKADLLTLVANCRYMTDNLVGARECVTVLFQTLRNRAIKLVEQGSRQTAQGQYDEAIAHYDQAIALDRTLADAFTWRAAAHKFKKDYPAALADFNRSLELEPGQAKTLIDRGSVRLAMDQYAEAREDYERALELNPTIGPAYANLGAVEMADGKYEAAVEAYTRGLELGIDPRQRPVLHVRRAANLLMTARYREAVADLERAYALRPTSRPIVLRGLAHGLLGNREQAAADFQAVQAPFYRAVWAALVTGNLDLLREAEPGSEWDAKLGNALLGEIPEAKLFEELEAIPDETLRLQRICEAAGFLGMRDEKQNRKRALLNYKKAVATGSWQFLPYIWARARLNEWED